METAPPGASPAAPVAATPVEVAAGPPADGGTPAGAAEEAAAGAGRAKRKCSEADTAMDALLAAAAEEKKPVMQVDEGHHAALLAALRALRDGSPDSCDLQLIGADGTGCAVHRCVALAMAPGLGEKLPDSPSGSIILPGISGAALSALADYMYSGELGVANSNAAELLAAARSLGMSGAAELCGRFLKKAISAANVLKRLSIALDAGLTQLADAALAFVDKRFEQVVASKDWAELGGEQVAAILRRDSLMAPGGEVRVFGALKAWAGADPEARRPAYLAMFADPSVVRLPYLEGEELEQLDTDAELAASPAAVALLHEELKRRVLKKPPGVARRAAPPAAPVRKGLVGKRVSKRFEDGNWYHGAIQGTEREAATGLVLYQVVYEDGDAEDVYEDEAEAMIAAAGKGGAGKKAAAAAKKARTRK